MIKIAVTIVHNKTPEQNEAQIQALLPLVEKIEDFSTNPETGETYTTYHYQIKQLSITHEVRFYQVIPHGVDNPPSLYLLDSFKCFYGPEDQDKGETRFFNWGLKRGTDHGADISVYLQDPVALTQVKLRQALSLLKDNTEFVETTWGKIGTLKLLKQIGQLKEDRSFSEAVTNYRTRINQGGLKVE